MSARKKISVEEYFDKNNAKFMDFANTFAKTLCDGETIAALAQKDLEKLAKVWKLVMEMLSENTAAKSATKLAELIGTYRDISEEE